MADVRSDALGLSDYVWQRLRDRLQGLTDEEYLWEPAPTCWTVRPIGDGTYRADWGFVFTEDPPLTTIAWRLWHIVDCLAAARCATLLGLEPGADLLAPGPPGSAAGALERLDQAYPLWRGYVNAMDEEGLRTKMGPIAGQWAEDDRASFVWHIVDELIHHAAEVGLMRDLYRATRPHDPFATACLGADRDAVESMRRDDPAIVERTIATHPDLMRRAAAYGRWDAVPLLIELGFPVDGTDGRAAIHHAAADGRLDLVRTLVQAGADLTARDPVYDATPLGWAEYFRRTEIIDYLRSVAPADDRQ